MNTGNWDEYWIQHLKDHPEEIPDYLDAAIEEGGDSFLVALDSVVRARIGSPAELARRTGLHRTTVYKMLSKEGNPRFSSIGKTLEAAGLRFSVVASSKKADRKGAANKQRPGKRINARAERTAAG